MKVPINFNLRLANRDDAPLFYNIIDRTMREFILATWGRWDEARVQSESEAHSQLVNAQVIEIDHVAVGIFRVARHLTHIQLEQIYLLPEYQHLGIGTVLLNQIMSEAEQSILPVRLLVMAVNPAQQFYKRLGFVVTETTPEFFYMEKTPELITNILK
jgi:ribosomal protein S18 acetylase RimI-like enzyme